MGVGTYLSRLTVAPAEWTFDLVFAGTGIGDGTYNNNDFAPAGSYPNGFTGFHDSSTAAESFRDHFRLRLEAAAPGGHSFTVTFSAQTGKFTVHCTTLGAGTWSLNFDQEAFGNYFGWQGAGGGFLAQTTAQTSPNVCSHLILSGSGRSNWPEDPYETSSIQTVSESGVTAGLGSGYERINTSWQHEHERYALVASPVESGTWDQSLGSWCWKDWFLYHQQTHEPFRYYESPFSIGTYRGPYVLTGPSLAGFAPGMTEQHSHYYWTVPVHVRKLVQAA